MSTLSFPSDPGLNDTYTFGGKTWVWNGSYWALNTSGSINGIVIGNVTPASGAFTSVSATGNITGGNLQINTNAVINGNLSVLGTQTIFNVDTLSIEDKDIVVANNVTGGANVNGAGLLAGNPTVASWTYNNPTASWQTNISVTPNANGTLDFGKTDSRWGNAWINALTVTGNIGGTLTTASQPNITSVGTLTSLTIAGTTTMQQALEKATISATAATGTVNYDAITQSVLYYTTNAGGNWTLNLRGSSSATLNSIMTIGQSITVVFLATQGATPYRQTALQIDGNAITPKWQGGIAPTAGGANGIDAYTVSAIKTGDATFAVLESFVSFA